MKLIVAKLAVNVLGLCLAFGLAKKKIKITTPIITVYFAARLSAMACIGIMVNYYPGDVTWFQTLINEGWADGHFRLAYGSLFCVMLGATLEVVNSPLTILIVFSFCEWIGTLLIFKASYKYYSERTASTAVMLYLLNPITLQGVWLGGQDEGIQILAVGLLLWVLGTKQSGGLVPLFGSIMVHATKPQSLWVVAPFLHPFRRLHWMLFALFIILLFAVTNLTGLHSYRFIQTDSPVIGGSSVWFLLEKASGWFPHTGVAFGLVFMFFSLGSLLCMGLPTVTIQDKITQIGFVSILFALIYALIGPFVFPQYCTYALPFIGLLVLNARPSIIVMTVYALWSLLYSLDASVIYRIFKAFQLGSPLSLTGYVWTTTIVMLHFVMLGIILNRIYLSGGTLKRGMASLVSKLRDENNPSTGGTTVSIAEKT